MKVSKLRSNNVNIVSRLLFKQLCFRHLSSCALSQMLRTETITLFVDSVREPAHG